MVYCCLDTIALNYYSTTLQFLLLAIIILASEEFSVPLINYLFANISCDWWWLLFFHYLTYDSKITIRLNRKLEEYLYLMRCTFRHFSSTYLLNNCSPLVDFIFWSFKSIQCLEHCLLKSECCVDWYADNNLMIGALLSFYIMVA